ncbi:MAG: polysaccharide biosynthesis protein, partial [Muribaculaceae bacterium]|nr:polysaccharide biosynthesis protein [Muribaculaceae bacterium]
LPVALLSLNDHIGDYKIENIPVVRYDQSNIKEVFEKYRCSTLIFLSGQQEFVRTVLANVLLDNNIKILKLNQVEEIDVKDEKAPNLSPHVQKINIEDLLNREPIKTGSAHIEDLIENQVVMITGAAGSIGSEIVRQMARFRAGHIVLVDQAESPMHEMQLEMEAKFPDIKIHLFVGDVTNTTRMERAFAKYHPRYVFHAAAYKHVPMMERNPTEAILTNVFGTKNIADLSVKYGVEKFVMISTDKAVNPTNIMGASKRIAEIYVQSLFFHRRKHFDEQSTQFITTRFGNVLGSNGSVIPLFRRQIEAGGPVTVTHRDIIRYFMTIPEACSLVLEARCMGRGGEIYIFDMGKPVKIYDLACRMISLAGLKLGQDIQIVETGLRPGEKLYEELLNDKELTVPTHHQKIMIAKVRTYDYIDVMNHLEQLRNAINNCDTHSLVAEMKHIVPEYHSNNSKYEAIDREIEGEEKPDNLKEINTQIP